MRIAHVCPYDWHTPNRIRDHVRHLAAEQRSAGHRVTVIAPRAAHAADDPDAALVVAHLMPMPGAHGARVAVDRRAARDVADAVRSGGFDVVHVHEPLVPVIGPAAATAFDGPLVATVHEYRWSYWPYRVFRSRLDPVMQRFGARIAVSTEVRAAVAQYFPGDDVVIPGGIDIARFADCRCDDRQLRDATVDILFAGSRGPHSGFDVLFDALAVLRERGLPVRLIAADDEGPLPTHYCSADVVCAPATGHGRTGIELLAAMAAGAPIVATDVVGHRTVARNRVEALLVPPHDSRALADAIEEVADDRALRDRLVAAGHRRVRHYAWPVIARRVGAVYESVLRGGPVPVSPEALEEVRHAAVTVRRGHTSVLDPDRPVDEIGLDSLDLAELVSVLQARTGVEIDDGDLLGARTLHDIALILDTADR